MSITYTYADALNLVDRAINRNLSDDSAAFICEVATTKIWSAYDWRESLVQLPPFYMIPLQQDYGPPAVTVPTDFWGLREAYWVRPSTTPPFREQLRVFRDLPLTHNRVLAHAISYETSLKKFRLFPCPPESISATDYIVDGTYKKRFTKVTADALQTLLLPWDDMSINVMVQALKWAAWDYVSDPRAGEVIVENGNVKHTGQLAKLMDAIDHKAISEGINLGDPTMSPSEPLANPNSLYTGAALGLGLPW